MTITRTDDLRDMSFSAGEAWKRGIKEAVQEETEVLWDEVKGEYVTVPKSVLEEPVKNPFDRQVGGNHYKVEGVVDITEFCMRHGVPFAEGNVMKYAYRHKMKNGMEDLRKAKHYLEFIAWITYGENL